MLFCISSNEGKEKNGMGFLKEVRKSILWIFCQIRIALATFLFPPIFKEVS